jgi:deoxyadenosine/deoxycytidine kinase
MICLDGNIGAGKSLVIDGLRKKGIEAMSEPVDKWTLLPHFYKNHFKYGFALQAQILCSYSAVTEETIIERGAFSAYGVFAKMLHKDGFISEYQLCQLAMLYQSLPLEKPATIIYLDVDDELCLKRIRERGRSCESAIDIEYIKKIRETYESFLNEAEKESIKVIKVNATQFEGNPDQLVELLSEIITLTKLDQANSLAQET